MRNHLNKKGFTLVELLAVIVILALVAGISIVAIFTSLGNAKKKAEKEFLTQLGNSVEAYIDLCLGGMHTDGSGEGCNKLMISLSNGIDVEYIEKAHGNVTVYQDKSIYSFDEILNEGILNEKDLVNPVNSKNCKQAKIRFYRDGDYVYYYKVILPGCLEYNSNIIHNFPDTYSLINYIDTEGYIAPPNGSDKEDNKPNNKPSSGGGEQKPSQNSKTEFSEEKPTGNEGVTGGKVDDKPIFEEDGGNIENEDIIISDGEIGKEEYAEKTR